MAVPLLRLQPVVAVAMAALRLTVGAAMFTTRVSLQPLLSVTIAVWFPAAKPVATDAVEAEPVQV